MTINLIDTTDDTTTGFTLAFRPDVINLFIDEGKVTIQTVIDAATASWASGTKVKRPIFA